MVPEPELEHDERPEPVAVLSAAFEMLGDEGPDGLGAEEAPLEGRSVQEDVAEFLLELVLEPAADGNAEAHLAAGPDRLWEAGRRRPA